MLKVVIDTNVFVSGLLKSSTNRQIINALKNSKFRLITSPEMLEELIGVMSRPKFHKVIDQSVAETLINIIKTSAILVNPDERVNAVKNDPDDNRFLEAALAGANVIVSGDSDLLSLKNFRKIPIIAPKEFLKLLKKK